MEERASSSSLHLRVAAVPISPYSQIPQSTSCHSRSLSQPAFFSLDSLPPLSPFPWPERHRRSNSDTPPFGALPPKPAAGHSVESQGEASASAYMGVIRDDLGGSSSSRARARASASASASASENEAESSCAPGEDLGPTTDRFPNLPQQSTNAFSLDFGNAAEFNAAELNKIMANQKLAEIALTDPKRVKRILANRQSAARSKERKVRYISELEHKVQTLQSEATTLSAQLTLLQRDSAGLNSQNNELKFRLQTMEQQAHLRDALNEALTAEVKRLKLATGELSDETQSSSFAKQLSNNSQMYQHSTKSQQNNSSVTKDAENE